MVGGPAVLTGLSAQSCFVTPSRPKLLPGKALAAGTGGGLHGRVRPPPTHSCLGRGPQGTCRVTKRNRRDLVPRVLTTPCKRQDSDSTAARHASRDTCTRHAGSFWTGGTQPSCIQQGTAGGVDWAPAQHGFIPEARGGCYASGGCGGAGGCVCVPGLCGWVVRDGGPGLLPPPPERCQYL